MKYWIQEFNVDGYRLDLSKGLTDNSSTEATAGNYDQTRINNITEYYNAAKEVKPDVLFILEHFCADTEEKVLSDTGMILWNNMNGSGKSISKGTNADLSYMNVSTRTQVAYLESHVPAIYYFIRVFIIKVRFKLFISGLSCKFLLFVIGMKLFIRNIISESLVFL